MSSGDSGRCRVGVKVSVMCWNILCRSATGKTCGDSILEVAALMYSMVGVETCLKVVKRIAKVSKH